MAILMLTMGYEQVAFAMGGKATRVSPVYFGICSVAYILLLIVEHLEENASVKDFADWISHVFGLLARWNCVRGIRSRIAWFNRTRSFVVCGQTSEEQRQSESVTPSQFQLGEDTSTHFGGSWRSNGVRAKIGLATGMDKTCFPPIYFGISSVAYLVLRWIQVLEDHIGIKSTADYLSRFAGVASLILLIGLISLEFALAIFVTASTVALYFKTKQIARIEAL